MSLLTDYRRNYRDIARDHVRWWRDHGTNPFQNAESIKHNEDVTFGNVTRYVPAGSRVLDAGCGMGDLLLRLEDYETVGVEIAEPYLKVAWQRGLDVRRGWIEKMGLPANSFDAVVATDVLEHVIDLHAVAKELVRVLRHGGYLILRFPNDETIDCNWNAGYEFVHLRTLDEGTVCILFCRLLGCDFVESSSNESVVHMVVRK